MSRYPEPGEEAPAEVAGEVLALSIGSALRDGAEVDLFPCGYCRQPRGARCVTASGRPARGAHGERWWEVARLADLIGTDVARVLDETWGMVLVRRAEP